MQSPPEIKVIFAEALERRSPEARAAYLDEKCGHDIPLRARVEALLAAHDEAGEFLTGSAFSPIVIGTDSAITEALGTVIGRYKLLEKIGEGGMAVVYMAEQEQPIRRKVALKIIKLGMDTQQVIARFEAERQALALMEHPNIAKVLDAGATETGRPYFVMELVQGVSITEHCDRNSLGTKDRLALFIQVCNAVQHAHQKGIIHRDIKPSNVMVTHHDGKPVPKIIDFGIAKAINQRLTEKTLFTRYAHLIGTPAYMSPEQAELSDLDIDTRTDIYSLGVLLYELLTGTTPFSEEELRKVGYMEMQRVIREQEPTKPSTKLTTLGDTLTDVAKRRGSTPDLLRKAVRGDLDWIVMKALEKDRSRRYETPNSLASDILRHLEHEPVLTHPPRLVYRLHKFLRRRRAQLAAMLGLIILIGSVVTTVSVQHRSRLRLAEGEYLKHRDILSRARESYARADLATAIESITPVLHSRHTGPEAQLLYAGILVDDGRYDEAVAVLENLVNERPEIAGAAHSLWAIVLWKSQSLDTVTPNEIQEHLLKAEELFPGTAEAYFLRAMTTLTTKRRFKLLDEALDVDPSHYESYRLRALTWYASRRYADMEGDATVMIALRPAAPLGYSLRAIALRQQGQYEEAIADYDRAIKLMPTEDPQSVKLNGQRCETLMHMGEYEQVIIDANECLEQHPNETVLHFHIFCALTALGRYGEASTLFDRATDADPASRNRFRDWSMKYVSDTLDAGRPWHPPESAPEGIAFLAMLEAEEVYHHLSARGAMRLIDGGFAPDWSPDGQKLAFALGLPGHSGVAVFDVTSGGIDLLIAPGKDPHWSPDGGYIAFVRDCQILPLPELLASERPNQFRAYRGEEVWIMNADGSEPRCLAQGSSPSWGRDSKHLYWQRPGYGGSHSISVEDREAEPKLILPYSRDCGSVSPNERYMAGAMVGWLEVFDLASQLRVTNWPGPPRIWGGYWHPKRHEFSMGGSDNAEDRTGLWIYDLDKAKAQKVLSGQITAASWAPDGTKLTFSLGTPFSEIWVASLDPNTSSIEALGGGRTLPEHYREMVEHYTRVIEADPADAESYRRRAQYYDLLHDAEEARADIGMYAAILSSSDGEEAHDRWVRDLLVALLRSAPSDLTSEVNSPHGGAWPCISIDGSSLYFSSLRPGGHGRGDIWRVVRPTTEDSWGTSENLGDTVNSPYDDAGPSLSADGLSLYFHSDRPIGSGRNDLWVSTRASTSDPWGEPENLGRGINSPRDDKAPSISANGLSLFFASNRPGGCGHFDLWVTTRKSKRDQ